MGLEEAWLLVGALLNVTPTYRLGLDSDLRSREGGSW